MKPKTRRFTVVAGSSQFYVADAQASDDTGSDDFWTLQAMDDRLATAPGTLGIGTGPDAGVVTVVVEIRDTEPTKGRKTWDHVTEASLELVSGRLVVRGCPDPEPVGQIDVKPGTYRVRVFYGRLGSDDTEQEEHYRIVLRPGPPQARRVLKRRGDKSRAGLPDASSVVSFVEAMRSVHEVSAKQLLDAVGSGKADSDVAQSLSSITERLGAGRSIYSFAVDAALAGDTSDMVLLNAMIGLAVERTDAATALPLLVNALRHPHPSIRALAIHNLSTLGSEAKDAASVLEGVAAADEDAALRNAAADALRRIRGG